METEIQQKQQEAISRRSIHWPAVFKTALGVGTYLFIFSGGTPWTGGGVANGILGRAYEWPMPALAVAHFALCLAYISVIAAAIFRLRVLTGIFVGTAISGALYLLTFPVLATHDAGDGRALAAQLVLGLFGSALYKALSIPKVRSTGRATAENAEPSEPAARRDHLT